MPQPWLPALSRRFAGQLGLVTVACLALSCGSSVPVAVSPESEKPVSAAKVLEAPGLCVDPPPDGDKRDGSRPFGTHVMTDVRSEDLDGDGTVDVFVKPGWPCSHACKRSVYLVRGHCGHWVGTFETTDRYEALSEKTNGLSDLSIRPEVVEDDSAVHCYNVVLKFDGKEYKPAKKRECECKAEGAKCKAWE